MNAEVIVALIAILISILSGIYAHTKNVKEESSGDSKWQGKMESEVMALKTKNKEQDARMNKMDDNIKEGFNNVNTHIDNKFSELKEDWKEQINNLIKIFKSK